MEREREFQQHAGGTYACSEKPHPTKTKNVRREAGELCRSGMDKRCEVRMDGKEGLRELLSCVAAEAGLNHPVAGQEGLQ